MSYEVTLKGTGDTYTLSDDQGEQLKQMLKQGSKDGFVEFGVVFIRLSDVRSVIQMPEGIRDKSRLLENDKYKRVERTPEQIKSLREIIYKHTKDMKARGVLPADKTFDVEKEFESGDILKQDAV